MTSPFNSQPWPMNPLQNSTQVQQSTPSSLRQIPIGSRSAPVLPPYPRSTSLAPSGYGYSPSYSSYNMPYSSGYGGYGGSYGGYPYRSSMYNSYGGYGGYNSYSMGNMGMGMGMYGYPPGSGLVSDEAERRFIQYAEQSSRNTFANVESIVRAVNSLSMMLDNTFFAMTSSFRAVLSVADNFGRLRSMFGHIWYSVSIFRMFNWIYRKLMALMGIKVKSDASVAWRQAMKNPDLSGGALPGPPAAGGSSWPTLAFLGVLLSAPYIISKFLPKFDNNLDPNNWVSTGVKAKAAFDFVARDQNELTIQTNDDVVLAPRQVQDEMQLRNSGWAYAFCNDKTGVVPLNYLLLNKTPLGAKVSNNSTPIPQTQTQSIPASILQNSNDNNSQNASASTDNGAPVSTQKNHKTHTKRVSFGENQIFENVDLEDYVSGKKEIKGGSLLKSKSDKIDDDSSKTSDQSKEIKPQLQENESQTQISNDLIN